MNGIESYFRSSLSLKGDKQLLRHFYGYDTLKQLKFVNRIYAPAPSPFPPPTFANSITIICSR